MKKLLGEEICEEEEECNNNLKGKMNYKIRKRIKKRAK